MTRTLRFSGTVPLWIATDEDAVAAATVLLSRDADVDTIEIRDDAGVVATVRRRRRETEVAC